MRTTAPKKLQPWKLITEAFKSCLIACCIFAAAAAAAVVVAATHCGLCLLPAAADDVVAVLHFISAGKLFSISAANQTRGLGLGYVCVCVKREGQAGRVWGVAASQKLPLSLYAFDGFDFSHF